MSQSNSQGNSNLAKFAFNIYGTLSTNSSVPSHDLSPASSLSSSRSKRTKPSVSGNRLTYQCDKDTISLSQLNYSLQVGGYTNDLLHHVVVGGKNYLRILCVSESQQRIIDEINLLDSKSIYNSRLPSKLINVNTIKTHGDSIATGLSNGVVSIYKLTPNGQGKITGKYSDHKRTINSLDFVDENQLISGSQDGTVKLWDLRVSSTKPKITIQANLHSDPIRACQYSPHSLVRNKMCVLSVHDSGALCKFDLRSSGGGGNIYSPEKKWNLHTGPALSLHIHPEKEFVVTGGRDQRISVFNYGDGQSNRSTPDNIINTYGPVVKLRWSTFPNIEEQTDDFEGVQPKSYDIACSYLNDDPTVAIYNLGRKYIPKQIIHSKKPIQNFVWARNSSRSRNIWTLTKSNLFTSYQLDQIGEQDVSRPLDDLNNVAMTWDNDNNLFMVNQDRFDFELDDASNNNNDVSESSIDHETGNFFENEESFATTIDKPTLSRSYTHNPMQQQQSSSRTKSPVPIARSATTGFPSNDVLSGTSIPTSGSRPRLTRNVSQATQESALSHVSSVPIPTSSISHSTSYLKKNQTSRSLNTPAYIIPVTLPLPTNDEQLFKKLSTEYLVKVPDGFSLIDVCLLNASTAASVNCNRTCQVWRLLAVSLQEDYESRVQQPHTINNIEPENIETKVETVSVTNSAKVNSESSALENFVNSYSTSEIATSRGGRQSVEHKNSSGNLMDLINQSSRPNSFSSTSFKIKEKGNDGKVPGATDNDKGSINSKAEPIRIRTHDHEDLDDENLNIANSFALRSSPTSVGVSIPSSHTFSSSLASTAQPVRGSIPSRSVVPLQSPSSPVQTWLDKRKSELFNGRTIAPVTSGLSLALKTTSQNDEQLAKAWKFKSLLRKSLDYASSQGDIIFCATAALLFYDFAPEDITEYECLEWISLYIDILQKKRLFVNAANILNCTTESIRSKLEKHYSVDLDLRFYCSICQTLLVNEKSKFTKKNGEFGYWYCDECNNLQSKCVYCNEPCKGLAVTVGLKCGHSGHFGCLKEWFIEEENIVCPGGCDYHIL
ncbi:RTC1 Restriction of telomere capping protein 1 [Candida maltosa Xu316]